MKTSRLTWQITWRTALWTLFLGTLFGAIYGASVLNVLLAIDAVTGSSPIGIGPLSQFLSIMLVAAFIGGLIGAPLGLVLGVIVGLLISTITIRHFLPVHDVSRYVQVIRRSSALLAGVGTLVGAPLLSAGIFGVSTLTDGPGMLALFSGVPALLAALAVWRTSGRIAAWYVRATGSDLAARPTTARTSP